MKATNPIRNRILPFTGGLLTGCVVTGIFILLPAAGLRASTAVEAWAQRYNGPANRGDYAQALAVDRTGSVYVTGPTSGSGTNHNVYPCTTIAYSSRGTPLWTNDYSGPASNDVPYAAAVDPTNGNVYVAGSSYRADGGDDFMTIAYSTSGIPLWTNRYSEESYAFAHAIAVGTSGNVYVGGAVGGMNARYAAVAYSATGTPLWTNHYGPGGITAMAVGALGDVYVTGGSGDGAGASYYATIAYSTPGTPVWTNLYSGPGGNDAAEALAVDCASARVYVTGRSVGDGTSADYATIACSSDGVPLWTNRYNGPGDKTDNALAIAVDSRSGNVYVTGESYNSVGYFDYATLAYSSSGAPLWTNRYGADHGDSSACAVVVDSNGSAIVTGWSTGAGTGRDYVTIAYSSAGTPLWTNRYNGPANGDDDVAGPFCLAAGPDGAVYVTGGSYGIHGASTNSDFATIKYVPSPDILFTGINGLPDATCRLTLTAPTNTAYRLDASADLTNWLTLTNFPPLPVTSLQYTDTLAPTFPRRFYRTVWVP